MLSTFYNRRRIPKTFKPKSVYRIAKLARNSEGNPLVWTSESNTKPDIAEWADSFSNDKNVQTIHSAIDDLSTAFIDILVVSDDSEVWLKPAELRRVLNSNGLLVISKDMTPTPFQPLEKKLEDGGFFYDRGAVKQLNDKYYVFRAQNIVCCGYNM